jgi:hypothetical protein
VNIVSGSDSVKLPSAAAGIDDVGVYWYWTRHIADCTIASAMVVIKMSVPAANRVGCTCVAISHDVPPFGEYAISKLDPGAMYAVITVGMRSFAVIIYTPGFANMMFAPVHDIPDAYTGVVFQINADRACTGGATAIVDTGEIFAVAPPATAGARANNPYDCSAQLPSPPKYAP